MMINWRKKVYYCYQIVAVNSLIANRNAIAQFLYPIFDMISFGTYLNSVHSVVLTYIGCDRFNKTGDNGEVYRPISPTPTVT